MRWQQTEFILKGLYLGLLIVVAMHNPTWEEIAQVGGFTLAGLAICLAMAGYYKVREGYQIKGRWIGFLLFLLLENPGMVYAGIIAGLTVGTSATFREHPLRDDDHYAWLIFSPIVGGVVLGVLFWMMRLVRDKRLRNWLGLGLATLLMGGSFALIYFEPPFFTEDLRIKIGMLLLLGIPGFYVLTLASMVEESEVEVAAICSALGIALGFLSKSILALVIPLTLYYVYTRRVLPGLRVFKHVLRGISYGKMGNPRLALASLNRAVQLDPQHRLANEQLWSLHRRIDFDKFKDDPDTLAMVNYDLCLERVAWLLLQSQPKPDQILEAQRLLNLISGQRPALAPAVSYWRAVAFCYQGKIDDGVREIEAVLQSAAQDTPQRQAILFQAWQLALVLHPQLERRVGAPMLAQPGRRMEAIAAVERQLRQKGDDPGAWDLKRLLYADLAEAEYDAAVGPDQAARDFNHEYAQQLGLALLEDKTRWQRGCEYLRMAARGLPALAPSIYVQIAKAHETHGDIDGIWRNYHRAMQVGRAFGPANLGEPERLQLFAVVKLLGETAIQEDRVDDALEAYKFYSQFDRAGKETYRTLAELFERKNDLWMALHCAEHALSYDARDADLLARKDKLYYSLRPEMLKSRPEGIPKWFDVDYCLEKARWVLDNFNGDLDLLDWGGHLVELAQTAYPSSHAARFLRARVRRLRGEINEAAALLEEIRQHKPEKFVNEEERNAWFLAHRMLGDLYINEKPDQAVLCFLEFRQSDHAGADTSYKLGRAYENLGDLSRAAKCYEQVTAYEQHPLFYDARDALARVKQGRVLSS